ncbi:MAG: hypothetical protein NWS58_03365 [Pontimonas sp.]|nr:hypothetical protein [Pontimonas sp.]
MMGRKRDVIDGDRTTETFDNPARLNHHITALTRLWGHSSGSFAMGVCI